MLLCPECGANDSYGHYCRLKPDPRDVELGVLYMAGCTLDEIGSAIGLTRERVRQRLTRIGITRATVRRGGDAEVRLESLTEYHRSRLGLGYRGKTTILSRRVWRWRLVVALIRELSEDRSPSIADVAEALAGRPLKRNVCGPFLIGYLCAMKYSRGIFRELWEQAGVRQRGQGEPGHTDVLLRESA